MAIKGWRALLLPARLFKDVKLEFEKKKRKLISRTKCIYIWTEYQDLVVFV